MKRLPRNFYTQPTLKVAKQMLGKYLIRKTPKGKLVGKIVETEAYIGTKDKASHAYGGKVTERNKAEYLIGGHIYIYLVYGMYWQMNISTGSKGKPECVLIRALETETKNLTNGPGKLCKWMGFNKSHYGIDVVTSREIYLTEGEKVKPNQIVASRRINIDYAQEWVDKPWRFYLKDNKFVSKH